MLDINNDLKIWVCNHRKDIDLSKINDKLNIYNVYDLHDGKNIDHYNRLFSEYVLQYYIYENNIYSPIVGFCQYSKQFQYDTITNFSNDKDKFIFYQFIKRKNNEYYSKLIKKYSWIYRQIREFFGPQILIDDLIKYLNTQKIVNSKIIQQYTSLNTVPMIVFEMYVIDWNGFEKLSQFIKGYIDFIFKKYNICDEESFKKHVYDISIRHYQRHYELIKDSFVKSCYQTFDRFKLINDKDNDYGYGKTNCWRVYSYIIEILISIFIYSYITNDCQNSNLYNKGAIVLL